MRSGEGWREEESFCEGISSNWLGETSEGCENQGQKRIIQGVKGAVAWLTMSRCLYR
jgi:hypothetical protein